MFCQRHGRDFFIYSGGDSHRAVASAAYFRVAWGLCWLFSQCGDLSFAAGDVREFAPAVVLPAVQGSYSLVSESSGYQLCAAAGAHCLLRQGLYGPLLFGRAGECFAFCGGSLVVLYG